MGINLTEQDLFQSLLTQLKQGIGEYATAATEASCPIVRQTMVRFLNETMTEQADCFQVMSRQGWYGQLPMATRQDVQKAIADHRQKATQMAGLIQAAGIRPVLQQVANGGQAYNAPNQPGNQAWTQQSNQATGSWQNAQAATAWQGQMNDHAWRDQTQPRN